MSSFTKFNAPLNIQYHPVASKLLGVDHWVVTQEFIYYIGTENSNKWVLIPAGYLTDGASVPKMLQLLLPPWGSYGQAAVLHDYLCEHGEIMDGFDYSFVGRRYIDGVLSEAMKVLNVSEWKRGLIMSGVDFYRKTCRPPVPNILKGKAAIQANLYEQYERYGTFIIDEKSL